MHDAPEQLKNLQKTVELEEQKARPLVNNVECMYLLGQLIHGFSKSYLDATKDISGASSHFLQSSLSVMQKGQTFDSLYKALAIVEKIID